MVIILGAITEKECRKLTKSSFSIFLHLPVSFELLSVILNTGEKSEKVWLRDAPSNSTGNLFVGFSGMDGLKLKEKITKNFAKNTHIKSLFFEIKES